MRIELYWIVSAVVGLAVASAADASLGVGVGLGSVDLDAPVAAGGIYRLPDLPVINTGDETAVYQLTASLVAGPPLTRESGFDLAGWFDFSPNNFFLEPDASQPVKVSLMLPFSAPAGEYQVFLEASPQLKQTQGVAIGPAAATKLSFTVVTGSVLAAFQNRLRTWLFLNPVIYLVLAGLAVVLAFRIFRRTYAISIRTRSKRDLGD